MDSRPLTIALDGADKVSGLYLAPSSAHACLVLAHGAGTNMAHKSMEATARGLAERGVATLRYNFLYSERGSGRPPVRHEPEADERQPAGMQELATRRRVHLASWAARCAETYHRIT